MIKDGWIALGLQIAGMLIIVGSCYAAAYTRITSLENRMNARVPDHDILISLNTKMDVVLEEIKNIKQDLKEHINR